MPGTADFSGMTPRDARGIPALAAEHSTPFYLYDEQSIVERCGMFMNFRNAFGIRPRYAMKANSNRALLQLIAKQGLGIDASSLNEARRARLAGIGYDRILLTTQEVPEGADRKDLETMMAEGLKYNACSLRQLELVSDFAAGKGIPLSVRVHPGVGSGESSTRNTGDKYSCFGIHLEDMDAALGLAKRKGVRIDAVHVHIGSGGDPETWRANIDRELEFVRRYFPDARTVSFGGGFKEARMPGETRADLDDLGSYLEKRIREYHGKTGVKLAAEVEPGTFILANAGYLVTKIMDIKKTGADGFQFLVCDGGMEVNSRPLLYGSRHPFYLVSREGELLSSEFDSGSRGKADDFVVAGRCCESGDSQTLDADGNIVPRRMAVPRPGDYLVIGGCGAYCSSMAPFNYNSHVQAPEILRLSGGECRVIRKRQTLGQIVQNELSL